MSDIKEALREKVKSLIKTDAIDENRDLKEYGLNSIMVMKISAFLKKRGIKVSFRELIEGCTLKKWEELISKNIGQKEIKEIKEIKETIEKSKADSIFDLTDVQYAYWAGRQNDQELGGVGCHAYFEFDGKKLDEKRLNEAFIKLQEAQPMLRAKFTSEGKQTVLDRTHHSDIVVKDFSALTAKEREEKLSEIRKALSHEKLAVEEGKNLNLEYVILDEENMRLFLDVDLLVADVASIHYLITQLTDLYQGKSIKEFDDAVFADYLMRQKESEQGQKEDKEYWQKAAREYPSEAPNLPLKKQPIELSGVHFVRKSRKINKEKWDGIKNKAALYGMSPAMFLLNVYCQVLSRWITREEFIINIPLFNRDEEDESVKGLIADFTNLLLLNVRNSGKKTFIENYKEIYKDFVEGASHSAYSGVQLQREISRKNGGAGNVAPIVFACNIDFPFETPETRNTLGKLSYMISQTPQVWLDFQSFVDCGDLILCWDYVEDLFDAELIDDMYEAMIQTVEKLAQLEDWNVYVDVLTQKQAQMRAKEINDILPLKYPKKLMYEDFWDNAEKMPEKVAIIDSRSSRKITYLELKEMACKVAKGLVSSGVKAGDYVSITMPRGYRQIIAVLGIQFAGAAYVPVADTQPVERRKKIYDQIGISLSLSDKETIKACDLKEDGVKVTDLDELLKNEPIEKPVAVAYDSSAYVIMTSGSTGVPKGVEIAHRSAINTIADLNRTYKVCEKDTIIMVSAIDFDLSVYDMFGMLSAGGTIITLTDDNYKNPDVWIKLISEHNVTMWNSVPILFNMLITMAEGRKKELGIRLAFMSGDWIPIDLPGRFYKISGETSLVVAMGGATEGSIWSNYIDVPRSIPENWISIPYGRPLYGQAYRVLDEYGRICPNLVEGELTIGGVGVAKGYRGDEELTKRKYFTDENDIPWYRTGDNGRIWNDGTIEFLGRRDSQVKIKGHRIELGEIENAIRKFDGVKNAVISAIGEGKANKKIYAFLEIDGASDNFYENNKAEKQIEAKQKKSEENALFIKALNNKTHDFISKIIKNEGQSIAEDNEAIAQMWSKEQEKGKEIEKEQQEYICKELSYYEEVFKEIEEGTADILSGKKDAIEYFYEEGNKARPDLLVKHLPWMGSAFEEIVRIVKEKYIEKGSLKILDVGSRMAELTRAIFDNCENVEYKVLENTNYYKKEYEALLDDDRLEYKNADLEELNADEYDFILMMNSMHRRKNLEESIKGCRRLLKEQGNLVLLEPPAELLVTKVIPALLENGFADIDQKERGGSVIPSISALEKIAEKAGMVTVYKTDEKDIAVSGGSLFIANANKRGVTFDKLIAYLKGEILPYMMPFSYVRVDAIPQSKNGKVDHKKLGELVKNESNAGEGNFKKAEKENLSELEIMMKEIFENALGSKVNAFDNYFELGGDSLTATTIISKLREKNISVSIKNIFENPNLAMLAEYVKKNSGQKVDKNSFNELIVDKSKEFEPFPLTSVQFAYWVGRKGAFDMGSVSTQCYFEFDCKNLNGAKLQKCINSMIARHGMLKSVVSSNGKQQIMKKAPIYIVQTEDVSCFDKDSREDYLKEKRKRLSRQVLDPEKWPLFDFKLSVIDEETSRLHITFDNLILDGWSMFYLLDELAERYNGGYEEKKEIGISFRDQVMTLEAHRNTEKYNEDKKYWQERAEGFSAAPILAMKKNPDKNNLNFNRKSMRLNQKEWSTLSEIARENSITPTVFLLTAFSDALRGYSDNQNFTLNLTQFERNYAHEEIGDLVGDFTNLTLLEVISKKESTFLERAEGIKKRLLTDLEHSLYSAVEFERDLRRGDGKSKAALMPIVFTSGLGMKKWNDERWLGKLEYNISQTPQVWIDHQIVEHEDGLELNWDCVDEVLAEGLTDEMFAYYESIIRSYIENPEKLKEKGTGKKLKESEKFWNKEAKVSEKTDSKVCNSKEASGKEADSKEANNEETYENEAEINGSLKELENIWEKILKVKISYDKSFFEQGGDSLGMVQMVNDIHDAFGVDVTIVDIAEHDEIRKLAEFIDGFNYEGTI